MNPSVPLSLDLAALLVTAGVFIAASMSDLKTREISNRFWIVYGPVAGLVFALRLLFAPDLIPIFLVSTGATILVSFLLFQFGVMVGADSKAIVCLALVLLGAHSCLSHLWLHPLGLA